MVGTEQDGRPLTVLDDRDLPCLREYLDLEPHALVLLLDARSCLVLLHGQLCVAVEPFVQFLALCAGLFESGDQFLDVLVDHSSTSIFTVVTTVSSGLCDGVAGRPRPGVNVIPNMPGRIPLGHLQVMELAARDAQRHAAGVIGATFIDIKHESRNNHTCAPDQHRWVAGIIDTTTPDYNMAFHPSYAGSRYVATRVQQTL